MKTKVLLREEGKQRSVRINDGTKPDVNHMVRNRWQQFINMVADLLDVPAGLIMEISNTHMNVFLKSQNPENPYPEDGKDTLLHGLYCETVIGRDGELHIDNSLHHDAWKDNPDVALNMISYYGLPLKWSDGTVFGTICALDDKTNQFEEKYRKLLRHLQSMIEEDLAILERVHQLEIETGIDYLTNTFNRRALNETCKTSFELYKRYGHRYGLVLMDVDGFKHINDEHGHLVGDQVLKRIARVINNRIRQVDYLARFGGDEFVLIVNEPSKDELQYLMKDIEKLVSEDQYLSQYNVGFSYGVSIVSADKNNCDDLLEEADQHLYQQKPKKP